MTATVHTPTSLPPVECTHWCTETDGHASEWHPDDQACLGQIREVPLSRYPLVETVAAGKCPEQVHVQLYKPHEGVTRICLGVPQGLEMNEVEFTPIEACQVAQRLLDASAAALGAADDSGSAGWAIARLEQPPPGSDRPDLVYIDTDKFGSVCLTVQQAGALRDALSRVTLASEQATLAATPADEGHIAALRNRIVKMRVGGGRVNETDALALVIMAWNAHRAGEARSKLQMPRGGLTPENFPEPR